MTGSDDRAGLADVLDDHLAAEFTTKDVDATMATMTDDPYLSRIPVLTGGIDREEVRRFYQQIFIGHWPADITMERISRTVGTDRVATELIMSFTHGITMSHLLPDGPPTGQRVRLAMCVVAGFRYCKLPRAHLLGPGLVAGPGRAARHGRRAVRKLLAPRAIPANALFGPDWPHPG